MHDNVALVMLVHIENIHESYELKHYTKQTNLFSSRKL